MAYLKRSKRGVVQKKVVAATEDDIREQERALEKELAKLQRLGRDKKDKKQFVELFDKMSKRHDRAVLKGSKDEDFEEFLDDRIKKTRKQIGQLKREIEARKPEVFHTIAWAGARPKRERTVALVITTGELHRIINALRYTEFSFGIANPECKPLANVVDSDVEKGKLDAYLLRCALESGIGWATEVHELHRELGMETVPL